ncbi:MAG: hypothetical protein BRC27_01915 [Nanohaloarchaea archaeon SW_10_44_10]|nr:MAG: hypothetical protein BRC27_01915 [Nanohaloarchaea archaeon SW_10_44_10]
MRKTVSLILIFIMASSLATSFSAEMKVVDRTASIDDPAIFNITVENDYGSQDRFRISSIQSPPVTSSWFDYEYSKTVEAGEKESFRLEVMPEENSIQQNYAFTANLRSFRNEESEELESFFTVKNKYDLKITSFQVSENRVKPGDKIDISATVENTASDTIENFTVRAEGFNSTIDKKGAILDSGDSIRYNFNLDVPDRRMPAEEKISLNVYKDGEKTQSSSQTVEVEEVKNIERNTIEENMLLMKTEKVELKNTGNVEDEAKVEKTLPVYLDPLTDFEPEPEERTEGADQYYTWNVQLEPGESKQVSYTVSYVPAFGFVALLFLGVLGFKKLQTDLSISKNAEKKGEEIKVRLKLQNNSSTSLIQLDVKDFVPDIAEVPQEFDMAKPVVKKTSNGTKLEWHIESLEPGEQRILEYTVKPLVEVEGGVKLDPAKVLKNGERMKETDKVEVDFQPE